jgi:hypothetical protein
MDECDFKWSFILEARETKRVATANKCERQQRVKGWSKGSFDIMDNLEPPKSGLLHLLSKLHLNTSSFICVCFVNPKDALYHVIVIKFGTQSNS